MDQALLFLKNINIQQVFEKFEICFLVFAVVNGI